jgi:hypothetical protein
MKPRMILPLILLLATCEFFHNGIDFEPILFLFRPTNLTDASLMASGSRSGVLKLIVKTYVDELLSISDRLDEDLMKAKLLKFGFVSLILFARSSQKQLK